MGERSLSGNRNALRHQYQVSRPELSERRPREVDTVEKHIVTLFQQILLSAELDRCLLGDRERSFTLNEEQKKRCSQ